MEYSIKNTLLLLLCVVSESLFGVLKANFELLVILDLDLSTLGPSLRDFYALKYLEWFGITLDSEKLRHADTLRLEILRLVRKSGILVKLPEIVKLYKNLCSVAVNTPDQIPQLPLNTLVESPHQPVELLPEAGSDNLVPPERIIPAQKGLLSRFPRFVG